MVNIMGQEEAGALIKNIISPSVGSARCTFIYPLARFKSKIGRYVHLFLHLDRTQKAIVIFCVLFKTT